MMFWCRLCVINSVMLFCVAQVEEGGGSSNICVVAIMYMCEGNLVVLLGTLVAVVIGCHVGDGLSSSTVGFTIAHP